MSDTTNNLALWDSVARVPPEHLKGFKRGGGFSGTAIKPMWAIKTMTERFGPCGERWGMDAPEFTTHAANGEILVYCVLPVWVEKTNAKIYGVGGDKILSVNKYGPQTDDEAFKKAYTDALTNALKLLGVGADIHMGLWDGNKYVDEPKDEKPAERSPMTPVNSNGTAAQPLKREEARALFKTLDASLRTCESDAAVMAFEHDNARQIALLGDWKVHVENAIAEHRQFLADQKGKAA